MEDEINNQPAGTQPAAGEGVEGVAEPETAALSREQEEILLKRLRDLGYVE